MQRSLARAQDGSVPSMRAGRSAEKTTGGDDAVQRARFRRERRCDREVRRPGRFPRLNPEGERYVLFAIPLSRPICIGPYGRAYRYELQKKVRSFERTLQSFENQE